MRFVLLAISFCLMSAAIHAQEANVMAHVHPVELSDGVFQGPAVDWIVENAADAQFVVFGEQHNVQQIPLLVADVQDRLRGEGYGYLALELGPVSGETLSTQPWEDALAANAFSIAFSNDADLELIRRAVSGFDAPGHAVWGLDQSFSSLHLFEALLEVAPDEEAATFVKSCIATALKERRDYIRHEHFDDVKRLRELFPVDSVPDATQYIDALETSMRIYTNWQKAQDGAATIYLNTSEREGYMKDQFMLRYREAQAGGVESPKVIAKLGGAHVQPGIGMNRVITFGTFAKEFARANGNNALIIGIWTHNDDPPNPHYAKWIGDAPGMLIELRALRPYRMAKQLQDFPTELSTTIYAYDAVILLRGTDSATLKTIGPYRSTKMKELRALD